LRNNNKTLHIIGDSISIQYGPYLEKFIEKFFIYSRKEGKLGNLDFPEGSNAGDSSMVLEYLKKCLTAKSHWDFILLNCGLHDIKIYNESPQININLYERNLKQIFDLAKILSNKTIWVNTSPVIDDHHNSLKNEFKRFNRDVVKYNEIAKRLATSNDGVIIDLYEFCLCLGGREIYQDHVHFTPVIQKLQAAYIAGHISALL
jgi:hypothetical protein